jgi:hypothetical protein
LYNLNSSNKEWSEEAPIFHQPYTRERYAVSKNNKVLFVFPRLFMIFSFARRFFGGDGYKRRNGLRLRGAAFICALHCWGVAAAQNQNAAPLVNLPADSLNAARTSLNVKAMSALGAWAVGNIAVNGLLLLTRPSHDRRGEAYYFQQMNVFWNVVNLGLAAGGVYSSLTEEWSGISLFETVERQASLERILLFNAGLDVGYMVAGLWMLERAKTSADSEAMWRGYGHSLLLQGGFLLAFDTIAFFLHRANAEPWLRILFESARLSVSASGAQLGVVVPLR